MNILSNENNPCPCGTGLSYATCCAPFHHFESYPDTCEKLMRSRYSAYVFRDSEYLLKSWDSKKRPGQIDFSKETAVWQDLTIVSCKKGLLQDSKGVVEFKARFQQDDQLFTMHEISRFVRQDGYWVYLDGTVKAIRSDESTQNLGKNAPCSCGSGKKFKRCCGKES